MSPPSFLPPSLTSVQRSLRTNGNKVDVGLSAVPLTTARADDKSKMGPWRLDSGNTATGPIWKGPRPGNLGDGASGQEKKRVVQSNGLISASTVVKLFCKIAYCSNGQRLKPSEITEH